MSIEDRIIDLLRDEFGEDGKNRGFRALSDYKFHGRNVPRVTTIITEMQSDQGLIHYSNYLGFKHIDYKSMLSNASTIGKETHAFIESYIQRKSEYKAPVRMEVVNCTNAFIDWWKELNFKCHVKVLGEEQPLACPWFGGTYDLLLEVDGRKVLVDFKTSNHTTHRYFIQLAAYAYLINFNYNIAIDVCVVLRMDKDKGSYEMSTVDMAVPEDREFMEHCLFTFFSQVNMYYAMARTKHEFNMMSKKSVVQKEEPPEKESDDIDEV